MIFKFSRQKQEQQDKSSATEVTVPASQVEAIVGGIAQKASGLGKESAELNGLIDDLAAMGVKQSETFKSLAGEIELMMKANRAIGEVTSASSASVRDAREAVEQLGQGVIGVTDTLRQVAGAANEITQIALQTRLVAFNASVEAKRAGEAGRGFSVVAEAVKDLASKVEQSSKLIMSTVTQLDTRIAELARTIQAKDNLAESHRTGAATFHQAVSQVERGVSDIASAAQRNLEACGGVIDSVRGLSQQVEETAKALQSAGRKTEGFLTLSENLIEMAAESGVQTEDTPYIQVTIDAANLVGQLFEEGVRNRTISMEDLFDEGYRPITGSNPQQFMARFTSFTDKILPEIQEKMLTFTPKVVFGVAVDRNGYLPTHNLKYSKPQTADPVWNDANCRNRRMFNGRTEMAAARSQRKFLLQTYRRNMGNGNFALVKYLSAPIWVNGKHWGAMRLGYQF